MARRFHPRVLFEKWRSFRGPSPYPSVRSELDAIQAGKKGMSMFGYTVANLSDADVIEIVRGAFARKLVIVLQGEPFSSPRLDRNAIRLFVARAQELWRIPAHAALWKTTWETAGSWTPAAEAHEGLLFGYTRAQRLAWRRWQHDEKGGWGGPTIYVLLDEMRRREVVSTGKRCWGTAATVAGMTAYYPAGMILRRGATRLVPAGLTLARATITWPAFRTLFGDLRALTSDATVVVTRKLAARTNAALRSNVQFLTRSGWR